MKQFNNPSRQRRGFTLLEVLVAATVIAVLSGVSLVGYNRFQERQQLNSAKEQLRNDLRQTQQKVLSGEKPSGWCVDSDLANPPDIYLSAWRLVFTSSTVYEIRGVCSDDTTVFDKSITLPADVIKSGGDNQVDFLPVSGSVAAARSFTLEFAAASGVWQATVNVSNAGLIESTDIGP